MASISAVARRLAVDKETVKDWTNRFAEHLSLTASTTAKGQSREFNEADLRVLALIAKFWEDESDCENIHWMLNCGEHNEAQFVEFAQRHTSIFQEVPDEIDETWQHGVVIGGMAMRNLTQVAKVYKSSADELVAAALSRSEPHEFDYPIIFLYRHAVELYLKAMLPIPPEHHDLNRLIELVEQQAGNIVAAWVRDRVRDFHAIDLRSDMFRYADSPSFTELWVDLHQLSAVMDKLSAGFEQYIATVRSEKS